MSVEIVLHPEVEEILRELARKPGSALLRVPRKLVERTVMERAAVAGARTSGLSTAGNRHGNPAWTVGPRSRCSGAWIDASRCGVGWRGVSAMA